MKGDEVGYPVWHLLRTLLPNDGSEWTSACPVTQEEFLEVVGSLPQHVEKSGRSVWLNAREFSEELGLSGTTHNHYAED